MLLFKDLSSKYLILNLLLFYPTSLLLLYIRELENKIQHFSSSNLSSQKEASIAKAALSDLQSEHQNCMASFADKCACYEKEIGKLSSLDVCCSCSPPLPPSLH